MVGEVPAFVYVDDVPFVTYSGVATSGKRVSSIKAGEVGEWVIITTDGAPVLSVSFDELDVFMKQFAAGTAGRIGR
jgi:hypothetical protein